jgi:cytochrome o ubiquinol oxidase subunit 1
MQHYADNGWQPLMLVALAGAIVMLAGITFTILQLVVSIRSRERRRDLTGDPWDGRTLEWSTSSPPPPWNFAMLPQVNGADAYWGMKRKGEESTVTRSEPRYETILMPRRSAIGFLTAFFAVVMGFALIWHIWWMAVAGLLGIAATALTHAWRVDGEIEIPVGTIVALERARPRPGAGG